MTKRTLVFRISPPSSGAVGGVLPDCGGDGISASQAQNQRSLPHPHPTLPPREEGSVVLWSILQRGKLRLLGTSSLVECWLVGTGSSLCLG